MTGYGVPPAAPPAAPQRPGEQQPQFPLFDVIGAALGVLSFIWGFLDWLGASGVGSAAGYQTGFGPAVIGLSIAAGAIAAVPLLDRAAKSSLLPAALAVAALLVVIGGIVKKTDEVDMKVGLILELATTVVQAAVLVVGWLQANGRINLATGRRAPSPQQWSPPQYGYPGGPSGYQQQPQPTRPQPPYQPPQQPSYAPPQQPSYTPQPPPGYGPPQPPPQQPGYGQPQPGQPQPGQPQHGQPQHGQPGQGQPGQGQPGQPAQPPSPPQQPGHQPGYGQPPGNPYGGQQQ